MTRDPDLALAIVELRSIFDTMKAERAKLDNEEVKASIHKRARVEAYVRDLRSQIALRADRIDVHYDALTAILSIDAKERARLKRRPSAKQMDDALIRERKTCAEHMVAAKKRKAAADAVYAEAVRADAAARRAELAFTGFSG